jgi:hypothetical protein
MPRRRRVGLPGIPERLDDGHLDVIMIGKARRGSFRFQMMSFREHFDWSTIDSMRKEELDRRSAELKARMTAERNTGTQEKVHTDTKRQSKTRGVQREGCVDLDSSYDVNLDELKRRIARVAEENEHLRQQVAMMTSGTFESKRSSTDSVREQRHNFFKYSNLRRY